MTVIEGFTPKIGVFTPFLLQYATGCIKLVENQQTNNTECLW